MTDDMTTPALEEDDAVPQGPIWDKLRAQHKTLSEKRPPLVLEVPGMPGLYVEYKYVPLTGRNKRALANVREITDPDAQQYWGFVALMVDACSEILVADDPDNPDPRVGAPGTPRAGLTPLCNPGDAPIKFDHALARGMGWKGAELLGAREIVRRLFGDEEGDYTLQGHAVEVAQWMAKERGPISEDFSGN